MELDLEKIKFQNIAMGFLKRHYRAELNLEKMEFQSRAWT